ncbi:hypothetical protein THAOC_31059, partial [Thalassiosira oceanica]
SSWRADLDWASGLEDRLSPSASLIDVGFSDFANDCHPEFVDNAYPDRTNHGLIDKPSGLCVSQLFCAYEKCWPRPDPSNVTQAQRLLDEEDLFLASYDDLSPEVRGWLSDPSNPSLNLPSKLLFPAVSSDVVAAIEFAGENGLVSVKNSGHSFMEASTKKDTLHINIVRPQRNCGLQLAAARNKPAYIRVGGGENWDKVYRAVDAANAEQGNKYHVVGGAAGTVSPMGWTFQGGLAGTQGGRKYGFGVDQVLQVEMVLPNGQHVKFGPVEWEDASSDGFIVPKTTSVGGMCRLNPEEPDESLWEWADCPEGAGIDFDDLCNVSQAESDACGMADAGLSILMCYGDGAYGTLVERWESYTNGYYDPAVYGVSLDDALACPETIEGTWSDIMKYPEGPYKGQVADVPYPTIRSDSGGSMLNVLYPKSWVDENFETLMSISGIHLCRLFNTTDADSFPSFKGANHVGNTFMGPMRDDWTRACPSDLTQEERAAECVSIQETLWGTETLARLERIKEAIDPNYMFDCEGCAGNNKSSKGCPNE